MKKKSHTPGKDKKILIVAYVFPPIAYAGTFRTMRLCKYLARMGYQVTVLTIKPQPDLHNDFGLLKELDSKLNIVRTTTIDPWRFYQRIKRHFTKSFLGRILDKIFSCVLSFVCIPDHMVFWVPFAIYQAIKIIQKDSISILYTSSPPHSEQIIGILLKMLFKLRWIVDFRDPIQDNMIFDELYWFEKSLARLLEKRIVELSDHIIVNTHYVKNKLRERYNTHKITTLYNSFDPEDFAGLEVRKYKAFTVSHIGSLYSFRKIDYVLLALKALVKDKVFGTDDFRLRLIGLNDERISKQINQHGLRDYVTIEKMIPHAEALRIMRRSHLLLLIKGFGKNSEAQIPGKLFEYLGSGTKIVYVGPEECEAATLIREFDAGYVTGPKWERLADVLLNEYIRVARSEQEEKITKDNTVPLLHKYSAPFMAAKFDSILRQL